VFFKVRAATEIYTLSYALALHAALSICMAARLTGRELALVPASVGAERRSLIEGYCEPWVKVQTIPFDTATGLLDLDRIREALSDQIACVYFEMPGFLGTIETQALQIAGLARDAGAMTVVGVDPISLGVLEAPPRYGADIVCGEIQSLGIHMHYGGGLGGFVASSDSERLVSEYPMFLIGLGPTAVEGEYGGEVVWDRLYIQRGDPRGHRHHPEPVRDRGRRLHGAARPARPSGARAGHAQPPPTPPDGWASGGRSPALRRRSSRSSCRLRSRRTVAGSTAPRERGPRGPDLSSHPWSSGRARCSASPRSTPKPIDRLAGELEEVL
jgi:hypothetical protein